MTPGFKEVFATIKWNYQFIVTNGQPEAQLQLTNERGTKLYDGNIQSNITIKDTLQTATLTAIRYLAGYFNDTIKNIQATRGPNNLNLPAMTPIPTNSHIYIGNDTTSANATVRLQLQGNYIYTKTADANGIIPAQTIAASIPAGGADITLSITDNNSYTQDITKVIHVNDNDKVGLDILLSQFTARAKTSETNKEMQFTFGTATGKAGTDLTINRRANNITETLTGTATYADNYNKNITMTPGFKEVFATINWSYQFIVTNGQSGAQLQLINERGTKLYDGNVQSNITIKDTLQAATLTAIRYLAGYFNDTIKNIQATRGPNNLNLPAMTPIPTTGELTIGNDTTSTGATVRLQVQGNYIYTKTADAKGIIPLQTIQTEIPTSGIDVTLSVTDNNSYTQDITKVIHVYNHDKIGLDILLSQFTARAKTSETNKEMQFTFGTATGKAGTDLTINRRANNITETLTGTATYADNYSKNITMTPGFKDVHATINWNYQFIVTNGQPGAQLQLINERGTKLYDGNVQSNITIKDTLQAATLTAIRTLTDYVNDTIKNIQATRGPNNLNLPAMTPIPVSNTYNITLIVEDIMGQLPNAGTMQVHEPDGDIVNVAMNGNKYHTFTISGNFDQTKKIKLTFTNDIASSTGALDPWTASANNSYEAPEAGVVGWYKNTPDTLSIPISWAVASGNHFITVADMYSKNSDKVRQMAADPIVPANDPTNYEWYNYESAKRTINAVTYTRDLKDLSDLTADQIALMNEARDLFVNSPAFHTAQGLYLFNFKTGEIAMDPGTFSTTGMIMALYQSNDADGNSKTTNGYTYNSAFGSVKSLALIGDFNTLVAELGGAYSISDYNDGNSTTNTWAFSSDSNGKINGVNGIGTRVLRLVHMMPGGTIPAYQSTVAASGFASQQ